MITAITYAYILASTYTQFPFSADWSKVERIGAPSYHFVDVERYRFSEPNLKNPNFYPIPTVKVTRASYMNVLNQIDLANLITNTNQGERGPFLYLPILAKYAQTKDPIWGEAIISMLKNYHRTLQETVEERKWFWDFEWPAVAMALHRHYLIEGGLMQADSSWFRQIWLYYCRNLHVWDSEPTEWRGGCHRSMPEGLSKWLAAKWYPDIPEANRWRDLGQDNFRDFWRNKDIPQNDTGYMMGPLIMLTCISDQILGDDRYYNDPGMKRIWDRLLVEITPDGAINPYGPNGGYNSTADFRIFTLEQVARKTGNGQYRYGAHKLFNYLSYQYKDSKDFDKPHYASLMALAWLFTQDSIDPIPPEPHSLWNNRNLALRLPHTDKSLTERLLGNASPHPQRGHICCSWVINDQVWPNKLILRSGWESGDLFALIELHPTSFPANPGGIMGINRYGTPFTQIVTSKGSSEENRLLIEDLDDAASRRYHLDPLRINEDWKMGKMPDIRSEVSYFEETKEATYVRIRVENADGLPVIYEREFIFVKNRFLVSREIVNFEEEFQARVSPLWNTQNIGPQIGAHWANTFLSAPIGGNGRFSMKSPAVDLLVWFAPRPDRQLQIIDRLSMDPRTSDCPAQLRYTWQGKVKVGQKMVFTQLYYPHLPYRFRTSNNNPGAKVENRHDLQSTVGASGISVLRDDIETTILRVELAEDEIEWIVFNPHCKPIAVDNLEITHPYAYIGNKTNK